jgi:hypothetical protein
VVVVELKKGANERTRERRGGSVRGRGEASQRANERFLRWGETIVTDRPGDRANDIGCAGRDTFPDWGCCGERQNGDETETVTVTGATLGRSAPEWDVM